MPQTLAIEKVSLYELESKFGLQLNRDPNFFREWQDDLPSLTIAEQERLQRVLAISANLERRSVLENTVKMAIVSPISFFACGTLSMSVDIYSSASWTFDCFKYHLFLP